MNSIRQMLTFLVVGGMVFATAATSALAADPDKLALRMCWTPSGSDSPYYLALERGYFREEGIDLELGFVMGSATCFQLMGRGEAPITTPDFGALTKAVAKGVETKAIFGIFQKTNMVVVSRADRPIKSPKELEGKTIAMAPTESTALIFPALAAANELDRDKVKFVQPSANGKVAMFLNGDVDAITAAANVQVPAIQKKMSVHMFSYGDFGVNVMNNGIAANVDWLEKNSDLARRFLRAVSRGWAAAAEDPAASVAALIQHNPDQQDQRDTYISQLRLTFPLLHTAHTEGHPIGWMSREDWEQTRDLMAKYGGLEEPMPVENYYTNDYVPQK